MYLSIIENIKKLQGWYVYQKYFTPRLDIFLLTFIPILIFGHKNAVQFQDCRSTENTSYTS